MKLGTNVPSGMVISLKPHKVSTNEATIFQDRSLVALNAPTRTLYSTLSHLLCAGGAVATQGDMSSVGGIIQQSALFGRTLDTKMIKLLIFLLPCFYLFSINLMAEISPEVIAF